MTEIRDVVLSVAAVLIVIMMGFQTASISRATNTLPEVPAIEWRELPDSEGLKAELIGRRLHEVGGTDLWVFESLEEFEEIKIVDLQTEGRLAEYRISLRLKNPESGSQSEVSANVIYKRVGSKWQFASVFQRGEFKSND